MEDIPMTVAELISEQKRVLDSYDFEKVGECKVTLYRCRCESVTTFETKHAWSAWVIRELKERDYQDKLFKYMSERKSLRECQGYLEKCHALVS